VSGARAADPGVGARLVWSDEFDGPEGAPPDSAKWTRELGDGTAQGIPGWGNGELQCYTDELENAALDGAGSLVLTARRRAQPSARCAYTSARLVTKGKLELAHGRIEACIRVPRGRGLWPAFWALGANIDRAPWPACGEIDVMEHVGRSPRRVLGTIHGPGYSGESGFGGVVDMAADLADDFHVFAVDWEPGLLVWTLDSSPYHAARPENVAPNEWVFEHPFFLVVNLAVGGTFGGEVGDDTEFPQSMSVEYVRVYELSSDDASDA
jgi:beta-glucanase (GH16 family)